jgi:hypothetical protein
LLTFTLEVVPRNGSSGAVLGTTWLPALRLTTRQAPLQQATEIIQ